MSRLRLYISIVATLCAFILVTGALAAEKKLPRPLPGTMTEAKSSGKRFITIDFDNVDIRLFIKYISELTGKNFVVDKTVQGNVTIVSPTKISEEEAYKVFESVLEVHGFTTVRSGSVIKILPAARARSQNVEMLHIGDSDSPEDRVVTQLVPLQYSSPDDLKKVLTPLVSKSSVVIAHTPSGMLIITETLSNIQKLLGIIEVLDVESRVDEVAVVPLKNASASSLAKILSTIFQKSFIPQKGVKAGAKSRVKVVPYERVNALVVLAGSGEIARVKSLISLLDTEVERGEGNIHVFYLQNATAAELAKVLNALPVKQKDDKNKGKAPAISKNVKIMADEETNALIITATRDEYAVLENVIKKLDIPRRMVYLEALIMEVDTDETFEVGVQWAGGGTFADGTGAVASRFGTSSIGDVGGTLGDGLESLLGGLSDGFSLGVLKQGIKIGGVVFPNIAAVLNAYETDSAINIISTPQLLTTDNKKAEISVGENVPYITSQNTNASDQDYTTYEYKDVSTKLAITPHINQANTLRLEIATEVVKLKAGSAVDRFRPTTFKRTAETTVIVSDGDTVVIGGIIGQDATEGEGKIPFLGDIPLLGWLFKTHTNSSVKTNMFIFVTARIIKNPADLAAVTLEKEDNMGTVLPAVQRELHKEVNPEHSTKLTIIGYEKLTAGHAQEAKNYFLEALEINPENPFALMNMGVVFEKEGDTEKAMEMYQAVINVGTIEVAAESNNTERNGALLVEIAQDNIDRIKGNN
ncbi:MAG: type II secretion system secretin GspD [Deltaproteobacteria bacterium]|nr:type II secretion system secretin GspD [Deltaproteobacteria bacterium]